MGEETVVTAEQLKRALSANVVLNGTSPELFDHVHPGAMPGKRSCGLGGRGELVGRKGRAWGKKGGNAGGDLN
jgi:hypothetical protein